MYFTQKTRSHTKKHNHYCCDLAEEFLFVSQGTNTAESKRANYNSNCGVVSHSLSLWRRSELQFKNSVAFFSMVGNNNSYRSSLGCVFYMQVFLRLCWERMTAVFSCRSGQKPDSRFLRRRLERDRDFGRAIHLYSITKTPFCSGGRFSKKNSHRISCAQNSKWAEMLLSPAGERRRAEGRLNRGAAKSPSPFPPRVHTCGNPE